MRYYDANSVRRIKMSMETPIYDFLKNYSNSNISRLHMPGHKGKSFLGCELYDITEIKGADDLYYPSGIIKNSEQNATKIFGSGGTFYSTEGSTLCIKTMIYSAFIYSKHNVQKKPKIIAVRNVHKSFIYACSSLGVDVEWVYPSNRNSICSGVASYDEIEKVICKNKDAFAVYITSPNYLGEMSDVKLIADLCHKHHMTFLVDNAHGAYLKFCNNHPIDLGADMCCDSAHKTLPVLTGGAYLHVSKESSVKFCELIKNAMTAFGSTSPSYLIMASLDLCNQYLSTGFDKKLASTINNINRLKDKLKSAGVQVLTTEPLKLSIACDGTDLSIQLRKYNIECEYYDKGVLVFMFSTENVESDFNKIEKAFENITLLPPIYSENFDAPKKVISIRNAFLSPYISANPDNSLNQVCASPCVSCPPAIPIVVSGELITQNVVDLLKFYNYEKINIIKSPAT